VQAVGIATSQGPLGRADVAVRDYAERDVSRKVVRIIQSYVDYVRRTTWYQQPE
jgi:UDP-N-acetylglucosamine 2-epimerase (non-hydrolysing)